MPCRRIFFISLCLLILAASSPGQTLSVKSKQQGTVDAKLKIAFRVPATMGPVTRRTTDAKGKTVTQFASQEDKDFVASLSFIPQSVWNRKNDVWPSLEHLVGNAMKNTGAKLHHVQALWVHDLPAIQFQAISHKKGVEQPTLLVGQFILATDAVIFAQTASTRPNPNRLKDSIQFLKSIKRPGFEKPKAYWIAIENILVSYPPGILPRFRDGLLHLEDPLGNLGLLLRTQETKSNDPREVICSLAESLDEVAQNSVKAPTLLQGPGVIRGLEPNMRAWGFACTIPSPKQENEIPTSREVFLRYYKTSAKRLLVSGYARMGPDPQIPSTAQRRVSAILNSIQEKTHKDE